MIANATTGPLTEAQIEEYYREGYIVVRNLVPRATIDAVLDEARKLPPNPEGGWSDVSFRDDDPTANARLHQLYSEPQVIAAVEQIFEGPARIYHGMLAVVPARGGKGLPWHQDNQYNLLLGRALNTFIALSRITRENGILWVAPRSHLYGTQPSRDSTDYGQAHREAAVEPANGAPLPDLAPGDACIFDRNTYHRSLRNDTDEPRYAYAAQYSELNVRLPETGKKNLVKVPARALRATVEPYL